jgi:hypothetical protein
MVAELTAVAQEYVDRWSPRTGARPIESLADVRPSWDEDYCRRVAESFDRAPRLALDAGLRRRYDRFKRENLQQYQAVRAAGITVRPWLAEGQPYRGSAELIESVRSAGVLYVYLTHVGHGPGGDRGFHPLREPSGVVVEGVELTHNDVFRAMHDLFGHVMFGHSFSARGEFKASYCHMRMYSPEVHTVLFTEQIAQICWYFYGPHLGRGAGRRYPEQKVVQFPSRLIDQFTDLFLT